MCAKSGGAPGGGHLDHLGAPHRRDDDVGAAHVRGDVGRARVADGHRGVHRLQQVRHLAPARDAGPARRSSAERPAVGQEMRGSGREMRGESGHRWVPGTGGVASGEVAPACPRYCCAPARPPPCRSRPRRSAAAARCTRRACTAPSPPEILSFCVMFARCAKRVDSISCRRPAA